MLSLKKIRLIVGLLVTASGQTFLWAHTGGIFVSLSYEEEARVFGLKKPNRHFAESTDWFNSRTASIAGSSYPAQMSIRYQMPPVKEDGQGSRGTCGVFAAVTLAEFATRFTLSEQFLAKFSSGKDPGPIIERVNWLLANGDVHQNECKYSEGKDTRDCVPPGVERLSRVPVNAAVVSVVPNSDASNVLPFIRNQISAGRPVGIALYLANPKWHHFYDKSVIDIPNDQEFGAWRAKDCEKAKTPGSNIGCDSHAIVVTGYDDTTQTVEVRNSWGLRWKDSGYGRVSYEFLQRFINTNPLVALDSHLPYTSYRTIYRAALAETDDSYEYLIAPNKDLYAIKKKNTASGAIEVQVLTAASGYQTTTLYTPTALRALHSDLRFCIADNNDLFAIEKSHTCSNTTEIHVLNAADNYQNFGMVNRATPIARTGEEHEFCLAENRDVFAIRKSGTASHCTEVHVLTAASGYQDFSVHEAMPLGESGKEFAFVVDRNRNVIGIAKAVDNSRNTEIHTIVANENYKKWGHRTPTALKVTYDGFDFAMAKDGDLIGIKKRNTDGNRVEVHVLKYAQ